MDRPIGIFDSGLGGLTVASAIRRHLPMERLVYLGDTARVPYGTRSAETVQRYAHACANRLLQRDVKMIVVACNTASAVAVDSLQQALGVPVLGVIKPGARAGAEASMGQQIGVLATAGTVRSGAYERAIQAVNPSATVTQVPSPLLVPLAEEGWLSGEVPRLTIRRYLEPLAAANVDTIVLGCTHYPLLSPLIEQEAQQLISPEVRVVDSAVATATALDAVLDGHRLRSLGLPPDPLELLVTDLPNEFGVVAGRFLGTQLSAEDVELIDL